MQCVHVIESSLDVCARGLKDRSASSTGTCLESLNIIVNMQRSSIVSRRLEAAQVIVTDEEECRTAGIPRGK